jgi:hypothetical protein
MAGWVDDENPFVGWVCWSEAKEALRETLPPLAGLLRFVFSDEKPAGDHAVIFVILDGDELHWRHSEEETFRRERDFFESLSDLLYDEAFFERCIEDQSTGGFKVYVTYEVVER